MKAAHAHADAYEMYSILRTAKCIKRYDSISHQLLAEIVVSIATDGEVVGGNNRGSDILSPYFGKIEVKSRVLGTDGQFPRVSLKQHNLEKSDWIVAVRWTREFEFYDAVGLPKVAAANLFGDRLISGRVSHVAWKTWVSDPAAESFASRIREELEAQFQPSL